MRAFALAQSHRGIGIKLGTISLYSFDLHNVGCRGTRFSIYAQDKVELCRRHELCYCLVPTNDVSMFTNLLDAVVKMEEYTPALLMFDEMPIIKVI